MKSFQKRAGSIAAVVAFLTAFAFFLFAYPYHLIRREQTGLFLFDWDYIRQTYKGLGWLSTFTGDFLEQFFHLPAVGPLIIVLLLTGIGACVYGICRHFLGKWPSLAIAAVFYLWSILRETGDLFYTRYTVAVLLYLALILLAMQFKKTWMKPVAAAALLALSVYPIGSPYHKYYGSAWGFPRFVNEKIIGLDIEVSREDWDKVVKRSKHDLHFTETSYCYNLAHAMSGDLIHSVFDYVQDYANSLFLWISSDYSQFTSGLVGEAWFHLGDMTIAEQSAIIALQNSPNHNGVRYIERMARINLVSGEDGAAQKYLILLSKTLPYGKWAKQILEGNPDEETRAWIQDARSKLSDKDFVYNTNYFRPVLLGLLEANPSNSAARQYLICYDLLSLDLESFMEDCTDEYADVPIVQEAKLIWISIQNGMNESNYAKYGISTTSANRMLSFMSAPDRFKDTYWYYYMKATEISSSK